MRKHVTVLDEIEEKGATKGEIKATVEEAQFFNASYEATVKRVSKKFSLSESDAEEKVKLYWK